MSEPRRRVLLVDDQQAFLQLLSGLLSDEYEVHTALDARRALAKVREIAFDAVLLDLDLGRGDDGLEVLRDLHALEPGLPVIMVTRDERADSALKALRAGAVDYIGKSPDHRDLRHRISRAIEEQALRARTRFQREEIDSLKGEMIGQSPAMEALWESIRITTRSRSPVLVVGETGTGKELVARAVHRLTCPNAPFVAVNCALHEGERLAADLFGTEVGGFTGAVSRMGFCEQAEDGILFLDEIGDITPGTQRGLLRLIDNRMFARVGEVKARTFRGRIVAATNRDLSRAIQEGRFQQDLFYRLRVYRIQVPPLRERIGDVPRLIDHFLKWFATELRLPTPELTPAQLDRLCAHSWPGNIRELKSTIECFVAAGRLNLPGGDGAAGHGIFPAELLDLPYPEAKALVLRCFGDMYVRPKFSAHGGDVSQTAKAMGITRQGLERILRMMGIKPPVDSGRRSTEGSVGSGASTAGDGGPPPPERSGP